MMNLSSIQDRLQSSDASVRRLAVMDLPYSNQDDFVALALPCLTDPVAEVRMEAARALEGLPCAMQSRRSGVRRSAYSGT